MKPSRHTLNEISARKMFNLLQEAELAAHLAGINRRAYLVKHRARHVGQVRREVDRIIKLGEDGCDKFFGFFLQEYGVK